MEIIGYQGIFEFEFIVDENDELYFMENNFRNSGYSYAATSLGMPLPLLWMEAMEKGIIDENIRRTVKDGFTFMEDFSDFNARVLKKRIGLAQWIKEYKQCDCHLMVAEKEKTVYYRYLLNRAMHKTKNKLLR